MCTCLTLVYTCMSAVLVNTRSRIAVQDCIVSIANESHPHQLTCLLKGIMDSFLKASSFILYILQLKFTTVRTVFPYNLFNIAHDLVPEDDVLVITFMTVINMEISNTM